MGVRSRSLRAPTFLLQVVQQLHRAAWLSPYALLSLLALRCSNRSSRDLHFDLLNRRHVDLRCSGMPMPRAESGDLVALKQLLCLRTAVIC